MSAFRFFASYAHTDAAADSFLHNFYADLNATIRRIISASEMGFFDLEGIPAGGNWPRTLDAALNSTRCLLSFYSPAYFISKPCGQEVKALHLRLDRHKTQNPGSDPGLLIPVLWESEQNIKTLIPPVLRETQYLLPPIPGANTNTQDEVQRMLFLNGLRFIMAQKQAGSSEHSSAYLDIVEAFSAEIKRLTNLHDISASTFSGTLESLANDFPVEQRANMAAASTTGYGKGPKFVRVLFLVGNPATLANLAQRTVRTSYEDDPRLWRPFLPPADDEVANIVLAAVTPEKLIVDWVGTSGVLDAQEVRQVVTRAQNDNNVLVVIIDPWSALLPDLNALLKIIDESRIKYGAIFVPWNEKDADVAQHEDTLREALARAFDATATENETLLSDILLPTPKKMEEQLRARIAVIRSRIVARLAKEGKVRPLPAGSSLPNAPVPT